MEKMSFKKVVSSQKFLYYLMQILYNLPPNSLLTATRMMFCRVYVNIRVPRQTKVKILIIFLCSCNH